jgi:N-acetylneuraminic acid mutarotase
MQLALSSWAHTHTRLFLSSVHHQLVGNYEDYVEYPLPIGESQGGIIGRDLLVFSGFTDGFGQSTARCYAKNLDDDKAQWRRMDDLPISEGLTHGAVVIVGLKAYMCGGYVPAIRW